jgi:hypothetical protein
MTQVQYVYPLAFFGRRETGGKAAKNGFKKRALPSHQGTEPDFPQVSEQARLEGDQDSEKFTFTPAPLDHAERLTKTL